MNYIVNIERKYTSNADYYNETITILKNKYNFPIYINIKEIVSGITNWSSMGVDGILFLCKDNICLTSSFLDNLKYTGEKDKNIIKHYYSDYSLLNLPLKNHYDKYEFNDFEILLLPKQKLSVHIFTNADNGNSNVFYASAWIKFQINRYPN